MRKDDYEDIINLPHYEPKNHPRMSEYNRAAQFAPFAALTGHSDAIKETARLTDKKIIIDDGLKEKLNSKLCIINKNIKNKPIIKVTHFVPDAKKTGGKYEIYCGAVRRIDTIKNEIIFTDKTKISLNDIINIIDKEID